MVAQTTGQQRGEVGEMGRVGEMFQGGESGERAGRRYDRGESRTRGHRTGKVQLWQIQSPVFTSQPDTVPRHTG